MNDSGVVAFQADCISGGTGGFQGSVFVKRPGHSIESFVLIGQVLHRARLGAPSKNISIGRPALNNSNTLGFIASIIGGSVESAVVTKRLGESPVSCVKSTTSTGNEELVKFCGFAQPAMNQNGTLFAPSGFGRGLCCRERGTQGIFTCQCGVVQAIVLEGDPIPQWNEQCVLQRGRRGLAE